MAFIRKKILGLIGGVGPESTIEYYRLLISGYRERVDGSYPPIIINSVDLKRLLDWMASGNLESVATYLVGEIDKLRLAGATFGAIASNTPHIVFDELRRRSELPLISIVEATCKKVQALGLRSVGLFGTRYTMKAQFYPEVFARTGISLVVPDDDEQNYIHEKYLGELLNDIFLPETRVRLLEIADKMKERHGIEGLILGGTELPLLLRDEVHNDIRLLDTTRIHVDRILSELVV